MQKLHIALCETKEVNMEKHDNHFRDTKKKVRLIDADELLTRDVYYDETKCLVLRHEIDNAPTVDAVEVVRCKDCKHYNVFRLECHNGHMNGIIGIDGFCSYGERRTNGTAQI
jgi:hypothetical protein